MGSSSKASFRSAQASSSGARRQGLGRGDQSPSMMPPNGRAQTHTPGRGSPRSENRDGLLPAVALRRLCSHCGADIPNFQTRQDPVTASVSPWLRLSPSALVVMRNMDFGSGTSVAL
uniref:Uncharacterized protein n=1 Tax=Piliocolobus tephrosceles TaxID=591936 RepID=A0A8C9LGW2_9PRIM